MCQLPCLFGLFISHTLQSSWFGKNAWEMRRLHFSHSQSGYVSVIAQPLDMLRYIWFLLYFWDKKIIKSSQLFDIFTIVAFGLGSSHPVQLLSRIHFPIHHLIFELSSQFSDRNACKGAKSHSFTNIKFHSEPKRTRERGKRGESSLR